MRIYTSIKSAAILILLFLLISCKEENNKDKILIMIQNEMKVKPGQHCKNYLCLSKTKILSLLKPPCPYWKNGTNYTWQSDNLYG